MKTIYAVMNSYVEGTDVEFLCSDRSVAEQWITRAHALKPGVFYEIQELVLDPESAIAFARSGMILWRVTISDSGKIHTYANIAPVPDQEYLTEGVHPKDRWDGTWLETTVFLRAMTEAEAIEQATERWNQYRAEH